MVVELGHTLREKYRLRLFENKVLRKTFGAKRDGISREWRKLHNAELQALYSESGETYIMLSYKHYIQRVEKLT